METTPPVTTPRLSQQTNKPPTPSIVTGKATSAQSQELINRSSTRSLESEPFINNQKVKKPLSPRQESILLKRSTEVSSRTENANSQVITHHIPNTPHA